MKFAAMVLLMTSVASAGPALAISRYESLSRTCGAVQQLIAGERAVLLRYPSRSSGIVLYDRYVADVGQCAASEYAARTSVPTRDNPMCPVYNCRSTSVFNPH